MFNFKRMSVVVVALSLTFIAAYTTYASPYTVKSGDSLYKVGKLFNTKVKTIINTNKLSGNVIHPGQILNVPAKTYTVKRGDSLYLIGKKYSVSLLNLKKANNQLKDKLHPGDNVVIPKAVTKLATNTVSKKVAKAVSKVPKATKAVPRTINPVVDSVNAKGLIPYTPADIDILARLITAEADGESYKAKVAVGAVVINRVKDERFPNTIRGVINEVKNKHYQFTPVLNGWIKKQASKDSIKAAKEALRGKDPTNGAVFYFDNTITNKWLLAKPVALKVDVMIYTY